MTHEELAAERAALERAIAERQRQIEREETLAWCKENERRHYDRTPPAAAQPVVTRSAPAPQRLTTPEQGYGEARDDWRGIELGDAMDAVAEKLQKLTEQQDRLSEELKKVCDAARKVEEQLRYALEHKADIKKLDRIVSEFRSELLTERLSSEREMRAMEQRYYRDRDRGTGTGAGVSVLDLKEIN